MRAELGEAARVIATGGLAGADRPARGDDRARRPVLTLEGLRLVWERNRDEPSARATTTWSSWSPVSGFAQRFSTHGRRTSIERP